MIVIAIYHLMIIIIVNFLVLIDCANSNYDFVVISLIS